MVGFVKPRHVEITSTDDDKWNWAVWYGGGNNPPDLLDRNGVADSLNLALSAVQCSVGAAVVDTFAYD